MNRKDLLRFFILLITPNLCRHKQKPNQKNKDNLTKVENQT